MKLYDYHTAPNPRRVRVFLAEKGIEVEKVNIDLMAQEHKTPEFLAKNINGQIPVLELDDGTCICESVSICRYFESIYPQPALFGANPVEMALIDMHLRRIELQLFRAIGTSWVNGPVVAKVAAGRFKQIPEAKAQSDAATHDYYKRMDRELGERVMLAGNEYSVVDAHAMCIIDFAEQMVDLSPADELSNLKRWRVEMASRPSAQA